MASLVINYGEDERYSTEFTMRGPYDTRVLSQRYKNPDTNWRPCVRMPENRAILDDIENVLKKYEK